MFTKSTLSTMKKELLCHILLKEHGVTVTDNMCTKTYLIQKILDLQSKKTSQEYVQHELKTMAINKETSLTVFSDKKEKEKEEKEKELQREIVRGVVH